MIFSMYELGLLYGDGHHSEKYGNISFIFSTTREDVLEIVEQAFLRNEVAYQRYERTHGEGKENWNKLHILALSEKTFLQYLDECGFTSKQAEQRVKNDADFIRGYMETKGTLFQYRDKRTLRWRCSISGTKEDLTVLVRYLHPYIGEKRINQRLEREELGIHSESYRFSIDAIDDLSAFLDYIQPTDISQISVALLEKIGGFDAFRKNQNNQVKPSYKHYRNATKAMARELDLTVGGIHGGSKSGSRGKPIYLQAGESVLTCVNGWTGAYELVSMMYEKIIKRPAPIVEVREVSAP